MDVKSSTLTLKERQEHLSLSGKVACYVHHLHGWTRHNLKPYFAVLASDGRQRPQGQSGGFKRPRQVGKHSIMNVMQIVSVMPFEAASSPEYGWTTSREHYALLSSRPDRERR